MVTLKLNQTACLILLLCLCTGSVMHGQNEPKTDAERISSHVHHVVNEYRASIREVKLHRKSELDAIALEHALNIASGRVPFSHQGFKQRVEAIKPYARFPYKVAENIYGVNNPAPMIAPKALDGWIESPGHHVNLKGKFLFTGIGVARSPDGEWIVCQIYLGRNE